MITTNIFKKTMKENSYTVDTYADSYFNYLTEVLAKISRDEISQFIEILIRAWDQEKSIYFIGNGGSAATSSHFVNDLAIGFCSTKRQFRCQSLCDNHAVITAIANDYGYEYIFSKQLEQILQEDDVVVAISASGNSLNLIKAIEVANQKGATTVALTAFDGGKLKQIATACVHVPTKIGKYGPAEDVHMILDHLVVGYLKDFINNR